MVRHVVVVGAGSASRLDTGCLLGRGWCETLNFGGQPEDTRDGFWITDLGTRIIEGARLLEMSEFAKRPARRHHLTPSGKGRKAHKKFNRRIGGGWQ